MDWRLRRAAAADAPALSLVAGATFLETFAGVLAGEDIVAHVTRNSSAAAFAEYLVAGAIATLAEDASGAAPIGYTLLTMPDLPIAAEPGDIELKRIYALAPTWGSGLGAALMMRGPAGVTCLGGLFRRRVLELLVMGLEPQGRAARGAVREVSVIDWVAGSAGRRGRVVVGQFETWVVAVARLQTESSRTKEVRPETRSRGGGLKRGVGVAGPAGKGGDGADAVRWAGESESGVDLCYAGQCWQTERAYSRDETVDACW